jgi:hypothetical protein
MYGVCEAGARLKGSTRLKGSAPVGVLERKARFARMDGEASFAQVEREASRTPWSEAFSRAE